MNINQIVKELRWKSEQLFKEAEKYNQIADNLAELNGTTATQDEVVITEPEEVAPTKRRKKKFNKKQYGKMLSRIKIGNDPKLKAEAIDWFKKNYPHSSVIKGRRPFVVKAA